MATVNRIVEWEQHLNEMPPHRALRLVGTAIANRLAVGNTYEAGMLMHIQNRILAAVQEFKEGKDAA
jgi:hypothetical protein